MRIKIGTTITTAAITSVQVVAAVGAHKQGLPLKSSERTSLPAPTLFSHYDRCGAAVSGPQQSALRHFAGPAKASGSKQFGNLRSAGISVH